MSKREHRLENIFFAIFFATSKSTWTFWNRFNALRFVVARWIWSNIQLYYQGYLLIMQNLIKANAVLRNTMCRATMEQILIIFLVQFGLNLSNKICFVVSFLEWHWRKFAMNAFGKWVFYWFWRIRIILSMWHLRWNMLAFIYG